MTVGFCCEWQTQAEISTNPVITGIAAHFLFRNDFAEFILGSSRFLKFFHQNKNPTVRLFLAVGF
jgi:hypothetical protein